MTATPGSTPAPRLVIMVCTGNICRSAMAEIVLRDRLAGTGLPTRVTSAGVSDEEAGNPMDCRARDLLLEEGFNAAPIAAHRATRLTDEELRSADLLLAMTASHRREMLRRARGLGIDPDEAEAKIRLYREWDPQGLGDVPDPWYGDRSDFVETLQTVDRVTDSLLASWH